MQAGGDDVVGEVQAPTIKEVGGRRVRATQPIGETPSTVGDFWEWAFGDLVTNTVRSVFAEYVVALALGVTDRPRVQWDQYDLVYRGVGIEVKAVGRVQAWAVPKRLTSPRFDIAARRGWDAATNATAPVAGRAAAVWVFAECTPTVADSTLVADPDNWRFRVASTAWLNEHRPVGKSIALAQLARAVPAVPFDELRSSVDGVIDHPTAGSAQFK